MKTSYNSISFFKGQLMMMLVLALLSFYSAYGQKNSQSDLEIISANRNATETFNYAFKAYSTEIFTESKSYIQQALPTAKEAKVAAINAEKSLTELLQTIVANSENAQLIDNIKKQKAEVSEVVAKATRAYEYAEKACASINLEELQLNVKQVVNASDKVIKKIATIQHQSEETSTITK